MHCHQPLSVDAHCPDSMELEEVVGREHSIGRRTTWAESPAKVWREKASEQIEAMVFALRVQVLIPRNRQRKAVGELHLGA